MTNEQPEQWAVKEIETVTGDFLTESGSPFYRIEIDGYCADFDYREAAENFASAIQRAFAEREAELVGARETAWNEAIEAAAGVAKVYSSIHIEKRDDCLAQGNAIGALTIARQAQTCNELVAAIRALKSREAGHG